MHPDLRLHVLPVRALRSLLLAASLLQPPLLHAALGPAAQVAKPPREVLALCPALPDGQALYQLPSAGKVRPPSHASNRILTALIQGDDKLLRRALLAGEDPNACVAGASLVAHAARMERAPELVLLIQAGASPIRPRLADGRLPLRERLQSGHWMGALSLLTDPALRAPQLVASSLERTQPSLLQLACAHRPVPLGAHDLRQLDVIQALMQAGAIVNPEEPGLASPLSLAVGHGNAAMVQRLLVHGAQPDLEVQLGASDARSPWRLAQSMQRQDLLQLMRPYRTPPEGAAFLAWLEQPQASAMPAWPSIRAEPDAAWTAAWLSLALNHQNEAALTQLAAWGWNFNAPIRLFSGETPESVSPLQYAVLTARRLDLVRALLRLGADPNRRPAPGLNSHVLDTAIDRNAFELAALLLDHGADPNLQDAGAVPSLVNALMQLGLTEPKERGPALRLIDALLAAKANPSARHPQGPSALHWAVIADSLPATQALLSHGANRLARDAQHSTALDLARALRRPQLAALLSQGEAPPAAPAAPAASTAVRLKPHAPAVAVKPTPTP